MSRSEKQREFCRYKQIQDLRGISRQDYANPPISHSEKANEAVLSFIVNYSCKNITSVLSYAIINSNRNFKVYKTLDKRQRMERKQQGEMICPNIKQSAEQLKSVGSWTFHENLLYVVFLQRNKVIMQSKRKRRNERVFDRMAQFIDTRTSLQCRSHHQKFLEKLGDIKAIIHNFKKYLTKEQFRERYLQALGRKKELKNKRSHQNNNSNIKLQEEIQSNDIHQGFQDASHKPSEIDQPTVKSQTPTPLSHKKEDESRGDQAQLKQDSVGLSGSKSENVPIIPETVHNHIGLSQLQMMMMNRPFMGYPYLNPFCFQSLMPSFF